MSNPATALAFASAAQRRLNFQVLLGASLALAAWLPLAMAGYLAVKLI